MRRRLSLALLAVLVILAVVVSTRYLSPRSQAPRRATPADTAGDTLARVDSAERANARPNPDTMCFASRFGLPCSPH